MYDNIKRNLDEAEANLTVSAALYAAAAGDTERLEALVDGMDPDVAKTALIRMAQRTAATIVSAIGRPRALAVLADSTEAELLEATYALPETGAHAVLEDERADEERGDG